MKEIEKLFIEVSAIRKRYEHLAKVTGENFNVFKILGLQTSEVRLHSAFIAELLNPKGSHGQGELFLSLFLNQENIKIAIEQRNVQLEIKSTEVFVEYHTGKISDDYEQGGRIDILIEDANKHIIIENKIYALDQPKQLIRYHNFDPKAALFYLNLDGKVSPEFEASCAQGLIRGTHYNIISYKDEILGWLQVCMKEASALPFIRETIHQYINLIKRLTNQSTFKAMSDEIIKLFCDKPEYLKTVDDIVTARDKLKEAIYKQFFEELEEKLKGPEFSIIIDNYKLQLMADETDKFYFSYRLIKIIEEIQYTTWEGKKRNKESEKKLVLKETKPEFFEKYAKIISEVIDSAKSSDWSVAWYIPKKFKGEKRLDQIDEYITLYDKNKCTEFIVELLKKESEHFEKIKEFISNSTHSLC